VGAHRCGPNLHRWAWGRYDGDRRERRASRAAAVAAFEQLQRETHFELQDTLVKTFQSAARSAAARKTHPSETRAALDEYHANAHRAAVLESRVADSDIRTLVAAAIESSNSLAHASAAKIQEANDTAADALEEAILELGTLISKPPSA
jgi:hypothetical protein